MIHSMLDSLKQRDAGSHYLFSGGLITLRGSDECMHGALPKLVESAY